MGNVRINADPLSRVVERPVPPVDVTPGRTALLVIDMQYDCAHRDYGNGLEARRKGLAETLEYRYRETDAILPRIKRMQDVCRRAGIEVIFVRIASLTRDGRDHPQLRRPYVLEKEAQILTEIAPVGDEIVLSKTTSSPFASTHIDFLLRSMGIRNLLVCGVATGGCVELTVRDANDRGYRVT